MIDTNVRNYTRLELEQATVKIATNSGFKGTGFFISTDGYILTAWHCINEVVVQLSPTIWVEYGEDNRFEAQLDYDKSLPDNDIAVLKIEQLTLNCVPLGLITEAHKDDEVMAVGYPAAYIEGVGMGAYSGTITRLVKHKLATTVVQGAGQSGGLIYHFNTQRVIGIASEVFHEKIMKNEGLAVRFETLFENWPVLHEITQKIAQNWDNRLAEFEKTQQKTLDFTQIHRFLTQLPTLRKNSSKLTTPPSPFIAAGKIEIGGPFIGRTEELNYIVDRMRSSHPTSVSVVGEKRLGKTSLLYHFSQTWAERVENPEKYVVIYLSLENPHSKEENKFYQWVANTLHACPQVKNNAALDNALKVAAWNREVFEETLGKWKALGVLPVLCLDDFDALLKNRAFDDGFYENLRYLMTQNYLMLVIASFEKLLAYKKTYGLTSLFFNSGHTLFLKTFNEAEVTELVCLKDSLGRTVLSTEEQQLARDWGKHHPFLLQLAGHSLYEARQQGKGTAYAQQEFEKQAQNAPAFNRRQMISWETLKEKVRAFLPF
jgi:AAA+ ATPase superfamily predicted ATPase/V8-like Glu-specific endopeptidase